MSKPNMKIIYRTLLYPNGDKLMLETTSGYYPDPDRRVWSVMFGEYIGKNDQGRDEYNAVNTEIFVNRGTAIRAFDLRTKSDNPAKESGITRNLLKSESLADILSDALRAKSDKRGADSVITEDLPEDLSLTDIFSHRLPE